MRLRLLLFRDAAWRACPPVRCWPGSSPPSGHPPRLLPAPGTKGAGAARPVARAHRTPSAAPLSCTAAQVCEPTCLPAKRRKRCPFPLNLASPPLVLYTLPRTSGAATEAPRRGEPPPGSGVPSGERAPERRRRRGAEGATRDGSCLARRARSSPELWLARRCGWAGDAAAARPGEMSAEAGEGITFSVPPFAEGGSCRRGAAAAAAEGEESQLPPPPPGSFWNVESAAAPGTGCPAATSGSSATRCRGNSGGGGGRRTTVAYVINEASQGQLVMAESEALQSLREACETVGATLETVHFGKLDFGETAVLDRFYNAGACATPSPSSTARGHVFPGRSRGGNGLLGSKRASYSFTSCPTLRAASGAA